MAKKSVVARDEKRRKLVASRGAFRTALVEKIKSIHTSGEERDQAIVKLESRDRNESKCRVRNRCQDCGRPRGTYRKYGLCRMCIRKFAMNGLIPGLRKASW
jgi:small subunit ribosomal protein S14